MKGPGRAGYVVAVAIVLVGTAGFATVLWRGLAGLGDDLPQMIAPGTVERDLRAGSYVVYHEAESVVDGRIYAPADVSGLEVDVARVETGEPVPVRTPSGTSSYTFGGREGRSALAFRVEEPGVYRITAGYATGEGPETVLAVGPGVGGRIARTVGVAIAIAFGSVALAVTLGVVTFLRRRRARQPPVVDEPGP